ncbi:MAG: hypothetical protein JXQ93_07050 [Flavobacteriaceae bacterium]
MVELSSLMIELTALKMFISIESLDYNAISKDHIGEIKVNFQGELIQESVFTGDDAFSIAERIIKKSSLDS